MTIAALKLPDAATTYLAIEEMRGSGPNADLLADYLAARLADKHSYRLAKRDADIIALWRFFVGKPHAVAILIDQEIQRYRLAAWKTRDKRFASAPLEYAGTAKELLFRIVKDHAAGTPIPRERQIRRILESYCSKSKIVGHAQAIPMASENNHPLIRANQTEGKNAVNAMTPHNKDQRFLEALRQSPEVKKFVADEAARDRDERKKIIDAIAALDAKAAKEFPALEKAVRGAVANVRDAEKELREANGRLNAANYAKNGASISYTNERQRLELLLRDGAPGELFDSFNTGMIDELEATRKAHEGGWVQSINPVSGAPLLSGYTNKATVQARVAAILAAMEEAERLRLDADQSNIAERLAALRAALPAVGPAIGPGVELSTKGA